MTYESWNEHEVMSINLNLLHFLQKPLSHVILDSLATLFFILCAIGSVVRLCFLISINILFAIFLRFGESLNIVIIAYTLRVEFYWILALYCLYWINHKRNILRLLGENQTCTREQVLTILRRLCPTVHLCVCIWMIQTNRLVIYHFGLLVCSWLVDILWSFLAVKYLSYCTNEWMLVYYGYATKLNSKQLELLPLSVSHECSQDCDKCPCSVCQNKITSIVILHCGHHFCEECIKSWIVQCMIKHVPKTCPMCRTEITQVSQHPDEIHSRSD